MEAPSEPGFNLDPIFFGFKPEDRVILHENLFELLQRGEGKWDWNTLYNLPIHIRRFWIRKINKQTEQHNEQTERMNSLQSAKANANANKIAKPPF